MMQIALYRGRGFASRFIRWQTRGEYSHAAMWWPERRIGIEAIQGKGVRSFLSLPAGDYDLFDVADMTKDQSTSAYGFAIAQLQKPYDWTMVFRFVTRRQANRKQSGKWFCSELVFASLVHARCYVLERIEPWAVAPHHLAISPKLWSQEAVAV